MGVDLTVCPVQYGRSGWWLLCNRIEFDRDYQLFEKFGMDRQSPVVTLSPIPAGVSVDWYSDGGIKKIVADAYGDALKWCRAAEFANVSRVDLSQWNGAVIGMLCALPDDTPVVLYWH